MFSWPGEGSFRFADLNSLVGGGTTAVGEFASFPIAILLTDAAPGDFSFHDGSFAFAISSVRSHFAIRGRGTADYVTAYSGRMWVTSTGAIQRLEVIVTDPPAETGIIKVRTEIEYKDLIPSHARTSVSWPDGMVATNDTVYPKCRMFASESKLVQDPRDESRLGDSKVELLHLAPGTEISVALVTPIDSNTDMTGQRIEGRLLRPLRDVGGRLVANRDARIRGRIMRLERYHYPVSNYVVGLQFDELLIDGRSIAIKLHSPIYQVSEGHSTRSGYLRSSEPEMALVPEESRAGVQSFIFRDRVRLRLGSNFVSKWKVLE